MLPGKQQLSPLGKPRGTIRIGCGLVLPGSRRSGSRGDQLGETWCYQETVIAAREAEGNN